MRRYLYIIALFAFVIVSCTPDEIGTPFIEGQEVTITASMANRTSNAKQMPGKQRVSGKDAGATIDLTWNAGDQILVRVGDKSAVFTLSSGENTSAGEFTGKMPADGSEYSVSYPVDYSDNVLTHQTYVENGFGNGLMKMSTRTNGTLEDGFVLSADNAVLGLQLTGSQTLGEIVLTNTATAKTYTLHCEGVVLTAEAIMFYIVVPVKDWANGMRVEVYDNDGDIILMKEKAGEIMFSATDAMVMPTLQTRERGKRIGIFSVGEGKYVSFSQSNLQYQQSTDEWRFAREQYEYIGAANIGDGNLADKIDLFGWSADNTTAPFGVSTSTNDADYAGEFVDWSVNTISGDAPNTWRTLSADEWEYLLTKRKNASDLYGVAQVAGVNGMIILPDVWEEANGIVFKSGLYSVQVNDYSVYQSFTDHQWLAMENAGAVFLPALGYRDGTNVEKCNTSGYYWSNTTSDEKSAYRLYFYSYFLNPIGIHSKYRGRSVRLVHDTIPPVLTFTVNGVSFDMIYVEGGTFMMGSNAPDAGNDEQPVHEVTLSNYYIGQTEVTQHLWKKVMGDDNPSVKEGNDLPVTNISWGDCQTFVEKLSEMTGMHFRLPTEAEWEYAARGGQKSKGYVYAGSDNIDEVAWYPDNCTQPQAVGMKQPNELGIYDMTGNVYEWCYDWYGPYSAKAQTNPQGPTSSSIGYRIVRGGCWQAQTHGKPDSHYCRIANRGHDIKGNERIGLRIVRKE